MPYDEKTMAVLQKYRLVDEAGEPIQVRLRELGPGPKLSPAVIDRFVAADKTPNKDWLDWIFFQAGGGAKGRDHSQRALEQIKETFISERVNGYHDTVTNETHPPVPREVAHERWVKREPRFREILASAEQDIVQKLGVFGWYRDWPGSGHNRLYEKVEAAIKKYLKLYPKMLEMNQEMALEGKEPVPATPDAIATWEDMDKISEKVERYHASRKARGDIRLAQWKKEDWIYSDDYVEAIAPLTYAAAVKFGWDSWPWANPERFEQALTGERFGNDAWKSATGQGKVYVYIRFNVPVPHWVTRVGGKFSVAQLTNLALELNVNGLRQMNPDSIVVYDEEGRNTLRIADVKRQILDEPKRQPDPQDEEFPIKRGPNVYKSDEEAQEVVRHLDACMAEIINWAAHFDPKKIKQDVMKLDDNDV